MNNDAMIGKKGIVIKEINSTEEVGQVKVAGELWSAITINDEKIKINEIVKVTKVDEKGKVNVSRKALQPKPIKKEVKTETDENKE